MNFRKVNEDDILKDWLIYREQKLFEKITPENDKHDIIIDEISKKILNHVPKSKRKYVKKQLLKIEQNFMDYLYYSNEEYYRNGFVDGVQLISGCWEE